MTLPVRLERMRTHWLFAGLTFSPQHPLLAVTAGYALLFAALLMLNFGT